MRLPTYIKGTAPMRRSRPADQIVHYRLVYADASVSRPYPARYDARYDMEVDASDPAKSRPIGLLRVIPKKRFSLNPDPPTANLRHPAD